MMDLSSISTNGKMIFLACDQGMEHGPEDFNESNIDPRYIFDVAIRNGLNAVIFGKGISEKYYPDYQDQIPLIIKLNGHSRYNKPNGWGPQNCEVDEAIALGAAAVGYTIHLGSANEPEMFREFGRIVRQAHDLGVPAIAWVYPRGPEIDDPKTPEMTAYAARVGMELGADIVKIYHPGNVGALRWAGLCAGKTKVVISGGDKVSKEEFTKQASEIMEAGLAGIAVGRNVWQSEQPDEVCASIKEVIYQ